MFHLLGELREMLADLNSRDRCVDALEFTTIGMLGLWIEGIDLTWSAGHPQQNAGPFPLRILGCIGRQSG
jgi:hypothetical protein